MQQLNLRKIKYLIRKSKLNFHFNSMIFSNNHLKKSKIKIKMMNIKMMNIKIEKKFMYMNTQKNNGIKLKNYK